MSEVMGKRVLKFKSGLSVAGSLRIPQMVLHCDGLILINTEVFARQIRKSFRLI